MDVKGPKVWRPSGGPVSLDDFVVATKRVCAKLGDDAVFDEWATAELDRELYLMDLEKPEEGVFE